MIVELSGGGTGFVSLGRYHPAGDMARAEVFGTHGTVRCDFLDPADGERAQLEALRLQAESFAEFVARRPVRGRHRRRRDSRAGRGGAGGRGHSRAVRRGPGGPEA